MKLLEGPLQSKLPSPSRLVRGPHTVHRLGTHLQSDVPLLHPAIEMMIQDGHQIGTGVRAEICLIEIILTGVETGTETGTVIEAGTEVEIGTETGKEREIEVGGLTTIGRVIAIGGMTVMVEKTVTVGAGAGAVAEAFMSKVELIRVVEAHLDMQTKIEHLHLAIWPSLEICMVIWGAKRGTRARTRVRADLVALRRSSDLVALRGDKTVSLITSKKLAS